MEQILLKSHPFQSRRTKQPIGKGNQEIHKYSQSVANMYGTASRVPLHVTGDGNCLFNSVSVALQGNEAMASELRVRTCIYLVLSFPYYKNHHNYEDFRLVSPDLVRVCQMCATDYEFSYIFTAQGLVSVIGRDIVSVYPAINGMLDNCVRLLNTIVSPKLGTLRQKCRDRVCVMWTKMAGPFPHPQGRIWLPNHFVPLIGNSPGGKTSSPVSVDIPSPNFVQLPPLKISPTSSECELIASWDRSDVLDQI